MPFDQIFIIITVAIMFILMFREVAHPATIAFLTILIYFVFVLISPDELMLSVSNEGVLTLGLLFIVVSVIERTNITERILHTILRQSKSEKGSLIRLAPPLVGLSAFLNNTPLVVMLTTAIQSWSKERGFHASKLLLPISYLTIFGGVVTLIVTSTNLIVHGLLTGNGREGFTFFYFVPYAIGGVII